MSVRQPSGGGNPKPIDRRDFIRKTGLGALGGSLGFGLGDYLFGQQAPAPGVSDAAGSASASPARGRWTASR